MKEVFRYIRQHHDTYLEELFTFLGCESISTQDGGVKEHAEFLTGVMEKSKIKASIYLTNRHPIIYGERIEGETLPTVLVYGRYDVQPPGPLGERGGKPFESTMWDGKMFCRGVSDDKSQLFIRIKAAQAWAEVKGRLPVNIKCLFEGEGEVGSPDLLPFVESHKELLKCDVCLYSDSHYHESGRSQTNLGAKGLCCVETTLRKAETDLHSMMAVYI